MAAAPCVRVWFRLEGAASATSVVVPNDANVADLRKKIKEELADDARGVPAFKLVLSTADGKATYDRASAPVTVIGVTNEDHPLLVRVPAAVAPGPVAAAPVSSAEKKRRVEDSIVELGADDPIYDLWHALKIAAPAGEEVGSGILCFDIPGNPWITGAKPLGLPLFIREDVRRVWELTLKPALEYVVIAGTPGIGKTVGVFNWALISLAKAGHPHPVVLDLMKTRARYVLWPDGRVQLHDRQAGHSLPRELNKMSTILLSDPREEEGGEAPDLVSAKHIVVSSPCISNYKAMLKIVRAGARVQPTARLFIYPWTREEVSVFWTRLGGDVSTALQTFDIAGGTMRLIASGPATAAQHVMGGIDPSDIKGAAAVYRTFADDLGAERGELRHRVFHGFPPASAAERHTSVRPDFCSPFAVSQFAKVLAKAKESGAQELLGVLTPTQSLRGTIFESLLIERFAHRQRLEVIVAKRDSSLAGRLTATESFLFAIEAPEVRRDLADPLVEVQRALREQKTRLLVPRAENYAAVDCFLVCPHEKVWRVVALQMAVAPSHSYLPDRLAEYVTAVGMPPFSYCVVCLAKHSENMALSMADGALRQNAASRTVVERDGLWLIPFA